jgi:hypothetical protein
MTRECHVRFCERLGVKLPGATLPTETIRLSGALAISDTEGLNFLRRVLFDILLAS